MVTCCDSATTLCGVCREVSRVERFLAFGFELNGIHFDRKSSFNAFFATKWRKARDSPLKCVRNLWQQSLKKPDLETRIRDRILAALPDAALYSRPRLAHALFQCQSQDNAGQSWMRALGLQIIARLDVKEVLLLAALFGRKAIASSRALRQSLCAFYARDFDQKQVEELLVFRRFFDWTHDDVIKLAHIPSNRVTALFVSSTTPTTDATTTTIARRVRVLRDPKSSLKQVLLALQTTLLEPHDWTRALNTRWAQSPVVWRAVLDALSSDALLSVVPRVVSRFPNNRMLRKKVLDRLVAMETTDATFARLFCLYFSENIRKVVKIDSIFIEKMSEILSKMTQKERIVLILDQKVDKNRKFLADLHPKARRKPDLLDHVTVGHFVEFFARAFECFAPVAGHVTRVHTLADGTDHVTFPFDDVRDERLLVYVTDSAPEVSLWPEVKDRKLAVVLVNKVDHSFGPFRPNVLVLNGFDVSMETAIRRFARPNSQ